MYFLKGLDRAYIYDDIYYSYTHTGQNGVANDTVVSDSATKVI